MIFKMKIYKFKSLTSTNDYMKEKFENFNEYDVVSAETQTKGRARRGNSWISQEGMALFTFMVKKREYYSLDDSHYIKIPLIAGLAVILGLKRIEDLKYMFKWTNDVYLEGRKICGILVEKVDDTFLIGIGINVNNTLPEEINKRATSLSHLTGLYYNIDEIINYVVEEFSILYNRFTKGEWIKILSEINSLNYLKGKEVTLKAGGKSFRGIAKDINYNGEIEIFTENGISCFSIGEIFEEKITILR